MAKPTGARCNLSCDYCFYLQKDRLYPGSDFRMSDEVMEAYIRQTIAAHRVPDVTIAWQGGEPTLMGLDFFRRAVAVEKKYARPGMRIENTLQTNGVLIDAEWCRFLRENKFLVGLSIDGPRHLHDVYRHDKAGGPVFDRVVRAAKLMQRAPGRVQHPVHRKCCEQSISAGGLPVLPGRAEDAFPAVHPDRGGRPGKWSGDGPVCRPGTVRQVFNGDLRRVGPAGRRVHIRVVLRRRAGILSPGPVDTVYSAPEVWRRRGAGTQRRRVLL